MSVLRVEPDPDVHPVFTLNVRLAKTNERSREYAFVRSYIVVEERRGLAFLTLFIRDVVLLYNKVPDEKRSLSFPPSSLFPFQLGFSPASATKCSEYVSLLSSFDAEL